MNYVKSSLAYKKLLDFLKENNIDFLILPINDEYGNQVAPTYNNRLQYFTNFTGSNGTAIFCKNKKSAFFTDGRYSIQATQEINNEEFVFYDITKINIFEWIESNANEKVFGYCVELHNIDFVEKLPQNIKKYPILLKQIDDLWIEKKEKPFTDINGYKIKYACKSSAEKRNIIFNISDNCDYVLITSPEIVCWLLNIRGADLEYNPVALCYVLLHKDGKANLFINNHNIKFNTQKKNITIHKIEDILQVLEKIPENNVLATDLKSINLKILTFINTKNIKCKNIKFAKIWEEIIKKTKYEIDNSKRIHIYDGIAVTKFLSWLQNSFKKQKIYEQTAAEKLLEFRSNNVNFICPSFASISAFSKNSAIIHYKNKDNTLLKDGIYLIDSGGQYYGATTDITRTIILGNPTKKQKLEYTAILKGLIYLSRQKFPENINPCQIDPLARHILWKYGYDYPHGTGHGVGNFLNVHEPPRISTKDSKFQIKENIIISNEPGIYLPEEYGMRIENLMYTKTIGNGFLCFEQLTCVPFCYDLIDFKELNKEEILWINEYNEFIKKSTLDFLNEEEALFLIKNTKNISYNDECF